MFVNYLKIALRSLLRQKAYSIVNIVGLAAGLAGTFLILSYIEFEMSYDDFQKNTENLYRVSVISKKEGKTEFDSPVFVAPLGPAMAKDFPEVDNFVRLSTPRPMSMLAEERALRIPDVIYADSSFFDIFSFRIVSGNARQALVEPYSIVLTQEVATSLFGHTDPLGKAVKVNNLETYHVTGVVQSPPSNSDIKYSAIISFSTLYRDPNAFMDWNGGNQYVAYVRLRPGAHREDIEAKFPQFMWGSINKMLAPIGVIYQPYLQPFSQIHLRFNPDSNSKRQQIYIFLAVAIFILFIACVNFINLSTARATRRAREVGVRKALGANSSGLIGQFLSESILVTLIAAILAVVFCELVPPAFQASIAAQVGIPGVFTLRHVLALFFVILVVGVAAGSYPAFYLSSFQAATTLRAVSADTGRKANLRSILVVLQFAISIGLMVTTFVVNSQLSFIRHKELGFDKEDIVVIPLIGDEVQTRSDLLKTELSRIPGVASVSASSDVPCSGVTSNGYFPEGWKTPLMIHVIDVDDDYLKTFAITLAQGRNFSPDFPTDKAAFLINQTLAKVLGWQSPLGKTISRDGNHSIIGVVKDFHFADMHSPIEPLIITRQPWRDRFDVVSVKVHVANFSECLKDIESVWHRLFPAAPFQYSFLDESFENLYRSEERFEKTFVSFSTLAIWIALLGLLSLASYSTEQKRKEIGIRKILGASTLNVTSLLSREFLKWVVIANIIGWPAAYYFASNWLEDFAYRIQVPWWPFIVAGTVALALGWLAVSMQTIRAATANPVDALRYE